MCNFPILNIYRTPWAPGLGSIVYLQTGVWFYLKYVTPGVVFVRPTEPSEHGRHFVLPEHAEQPVQQDLESYGQRLATVQHQAGDVESRVWLDGLHGPVS